jgi:hypothetical protein
LCVREDGQTSLAEGASGKGLKERDVVIDEPTLAGLESRARIQKTNAGVLDTKHPSVVVGADLVLALVAEIRVSRAKSER